jgi:hypothetical protein
MIKVKDLVIKPIIAKSARDFIKMLHYSGTCVNNSCLHFGIFHKNRLYGVVSLGPPMDKRKIINLVSGSKWNDFLEINRMALSDYMPKNSESRCLSIIFKLIKKNYPHIKLIISFSDATQCGDGTIYRASGFNLIGIKENKNICKINNSIIHKLTLESVPNKKREELLGKSYFDITRGKNDFNKVVLYFNGKILAGYQIKYIYFIDKSCKENLTVPILPFSEIDRLGAGMYKGKRRVKKANSDDQSESGGAVPTHTLQFKKVI